MSYPALYACSKQRDDVKQWKNELQGTSFRPANQSSGMLSP
jgi:hypothetical protein